MLNISLKWISDDVYAIREEGCKVLKKLYDSFKCEEFDKRLVEKLTELKNDLNYLRRNIVPMLIKEFIIDSNHSEFLEKNLLPLVLSMSKDKVGNIRMSSGLILRKMLKTLRSNNNINDARYAIEELRKDEDGDVINILVDEI